MRKRNAIINSKRESCNEQDSFILRLVCDRHFSDRRLNYFILASLNLADRVED